MTNKEAIKMIPRIKRIYGTPDLTRGSYSAHEWFSKVEDALENAEKYRWHDLRKNKNDIPSGDWDELLVLQVKYVSRTIPMLGRYIRGSFTRPDGVELLGEVIAWREVEPFEELNDGNI